MIKRVWIAAVRFGFRLLYYELAWTYDVVSWLVSWGAWRHWQLAALPFLHSNGRSTLEIGHGPGHMLLTLAQQGHSVTGVDLSPQMGRQARRRLHGAGVQARLVRARVQQLPFAPAQFDNVLSTFPTNYIIEPETLAAVHRVLKGNGRFVIVPEGHLTGKGPVQTLIGWLFRLTGQRRDAFAVADDGFWPDADVWQPLSARFEAAGFTVQIEQIVLPRSAVTVIVAVRGDGVIE